MKPSLALAPYAMELLFREPPAARGDELLAALEARVGGVSMSAGSGPTAGPLLFSFDRLESGGIAPQLVFAPNPRPPSLERFAEALAHTRDWEEAELALGAARASAYVTDFLAGHVERRTRLALLVDAAATLCELLPVVAIHWAPAGKLVDPRAVVGQGREDPLSIAVNVRAFRVQGHLPGELFLDTLGLAAFGVPDLQCRFVGLEPEHVARRLRALARIAWEKGALGGELTSPAGGAPLGAQPRDAGDRWTTRPGSPLSPPEREVLDVEPALPFRARGGDA